MKLRLLPLALAFGALAAAPVHLAAAPAAKLPNIVLIFADDLGWKDVGYQSDGKFLTPNLDRFANEGMVFSNAYAAAANCEPSRACLISGCYTPRHGVYAVHSTDRGPKKLQRLVPIPNKDGLASRFVTIAEALKAAGYVTGQFGKWHLSGPDGALPSQQGFDVAYDSLGYKDLDEATGGNQSGPPEDPKGIYHLTNKACEFIAHNKDRPFFCYLAHHAIHSALQARPETQALIAERAKTAGVPTLYMGCTYDLDSSLKTVFDKLKELGLEDNTLVVFTSDNGAVQLSSQEPLRGNKGAYYEGGIREPFIVRWPGHVKPGTRCDVPVNSPDLYPTFLAAAKSPLPKDVTLDGESLLPLLEETGPLKRDAIFWHFPGYLDSPVNRGRDPVFRTRPVTAMRSGDWKLLLYHEEWQLNGGRADVETNNSVELYNLKTDPGERDNLALKSPEVRERLLDKLLAWMAATDAKMPTVKNPQYDPTAKPKGGMKRAK